VAAVSAASRSRLLALAVDREVFGRALDRSDAACRGVLGLGAIFVASFDGEKQMLMMTDGLDQRVAKRGRGGAAGSSSLG
jgi:hypothetical protein